MRPQRCSARTKTNAPTVEGRECGLRSGLVGHAGDRTESFVAAAVGGVACSVGGACRRCIAACVAATAALVWLRVFFLACGVRQDLLRAITNGASGYATMQSSIMPLRSSETWGSANSLT